jgi:hypothetical protein
MELLKKVIITPLITSLVSTAVFLVIAALTPETALADFALIILVNALLATVIALFAKDQFIANVRAGVLVACNVTGLCMLSSLFAIAVILATTQSFTSAEGLINIYVKSVCINVIIVTVLTNILPSKRWIGRKK